MPDIVYAVNDFADINRRLNEIEQARQRQFGADDAIQQKPEWDVRNFFRDGWFGCDLIRKSAYWHREEAAAMASHFVSDPHLYYQNDARQQLLTASPHSIQMFALKQYYLLGTRSAQKTDTLIVFTRLLTLGVKFKA